MSETPPRPFRYPPRFIHAQFQRFFTDGTKNWNILPLIDTPTKFTVFRQEITKKPSAEECALRARLAKMIKFPMNDTEVESSTIRRVEENSKWEANLIVHYTHEGRLATYKQKLHRLWNEFFHQTPVKHTRLIIGNRNSLNLVEQLIRLHPEKSALPSLTEKDILP